MGPFRRRNFLLAVSALLASPLGRGQAPERVPRVGFLFSFVPSQGEHLWAACRQGLRELGYVEDRTIVLEPRWANGKHERLPERVAELSRLNVDVIVAAATPASLAAKAGAGKIPIVIVAVADPIRVGLAASLARPGGNITGLTLLTPELSGKRVELVVDILGRVSRVAMPINPDNSSHDVFSEETLRAADGLSMQVLPLRARNAAEISQAFQDALKVQAQALGRALLAAVDSKELAGHSQMRQKDVARIEIQEQLLAVSAHLLDPSPCQASSQAYR